MICSSIFYDKSGTFCSYSGFFPLFRQKAERIQMNLVVRLLGEGDSSQQQKITEN